MLNIRLLFRPSTTVMLSILRIQIMIVSALKLVAGDVLSGRRGDGQGLVRVAGIGAVVAGLALAAAGQQSLGNSLSPFPTPRRADNHALITDGVYQYTR